MKSGSRSSLLAELKFETPKPSPVSCLALFMKCVARVLAVGAACDASLSMVAEPVGFPSCSASCLAWFTKCEARLLGLGGDLASSSSDPDMLSEPAANENEVGHASDAPVRMDKPPTSREIDDDLCHTSKTVGTQLKDTSMM